MAFVCLSWLTSFCRRSISAACCWSLSAQTSVCKSRIFSRHCSSSSLGVGRVVGLSVQQSPSHLRLWAIEGESINASERAIAFMGDRRRIHRRLPRCKGGWRAPSYIQCREVVPTSGRGDEVWAQVFVGGLWGPLAGVGVSAARPSGSRIIRRRTCSADADDGRTVSCWRSTSVCMWWHLVAPTSLLPLLPLCSSTCSIQYLLLATCYLLACRTCLALDDVMQRG